MVTAVYKPFKRTISEWQYDPEYTKEMQHGRKLMLFSIGIQQMVETETGRIINSTPVTEYIYEDVVRNIFANPEEYSARVNLGCEPQVVVTYENRLVIHNETVGNEVEKILEIAKRFKLKDIADILVNSELNYNTLTPLSKRYRSLMESINDECGEYYPPDFIGLVLREYFFEQKRELAGYSEDIHYMNGIELKEEIGKALQDGNDENIEMLKDELMYAFLLGDLITNPKIAN